MIKIKNFIEKFRFSLGFKINAIFGFLIALFIIFSLYNRSLLDQFSNTYSQQINFYYSILELKDTFAHSNTAINEYFKSGNKTNLADFNNAYTEAKMELKTMASFIKSDETIYLLRSIENSFTTYYSENCTACFLYYRNNFDYYEKMYYAQSINDYLQKYCDELLQLVFADSMIANESLSRQHGILTFTNSILIIFVILLFFSCVTYINLNVTKPLNDLVTQAREMSKGNINVKVAESKFQNTISVLSRAFNEMAQNIRTMMESIRENVKIEKKLMEEQLKNVEYINLLNQATFLALQTQTNPHFLFNTLNSISRTITLGKEDQALLMIDSLAALLRYSLTDAEAPVTLSQEISIINEYLRIQKFRFSERIQGQIKCEGVDTNLILLPRFTLQPLVENAIIHGLEPKEEGGHIIVAVKQRGRYCIIKIGDNGIGIPKEKLHKIRSECLESTSNSIGIWNTQKRIQLFTGQEDSFKVSSKENAGTVITIKLLIRGEEDV